MSQVPYQYNKKQLKTRDGRVKDNTNKIITLTRDKVHPPYIYFQAYSTDHHKLEMVVADPWWMALREMHSVNVEYTLRLKI